MNKTISRNELYNKIEEILMEHQDYSDNQECNIILFEKLIKDGYFNDLLIPFKDSITHKDINL